MNSAIFNSSVAQTKTMSDNSTQITKFSFFMLFSRMPIKILLNRVFLRRLDITAKRRNIIRQIVHRYLNARLSQNASMSLLKFVKALKYDHAKRFAFKQLHAKNPIMNIKDLDFSTIPEKTV